MKDFIILSLLTVLTVSGTISSAHGKTKCKNFNDADCLHAEGLYTDNELDGMDMNQAEVAIANDHNSELNKYARGEPSGLQPVYADTQIRKPKLPK